MRVAGRKCLRERERVTERDCERECLREKDRGRGRRRVCERETESEWATADAVPVADEILKVELELEPAVDDLLGTALLKEEEEPKVALEGPPVAIDVLFKYTNLRGSVQ